MFCPKCGMDNKSAVNFCAGCGNPLNAQQTGSATQQNKSGAQPYGQLYTHQPTGGAPQPYGPEGYRNAGGGSQPYGPGGSYAAPFKDYLVHNIVITVLGSLFCGGGFFRLIVLVIGIAGIVFSTNSRKASARGDIAAAQSAANTAKTLFFLSLAIFVLSLFKAAALIVKARHSGVNFFPGFRGLRL